MKELRFWKGDIPHDKHMDFYEAFRPMYVLMFLSFIKLILFKGQFDVYMGVIGFSGIIFARQMETYFD